MAKSNLFIKLKVSLQYSLQVRKSLSAVRLRGRRKPDRQRGESKHPPPLGSIFWKQGSDSVPL